MKNLIIGFAFAAACFACSTTDATQVEDASAATAPASGCCAEASECADSDASECATKTKCASEAAPECSKSEKTCPVSGETISS